MVGHPKSLMRPTGSFHLFIPPLAFSQISLDETLTILFITSIGDPADQRDSEIARWWPRKGSHHASGLLCSDSHARPAACQDS